ncbi:MAG: hypothetical protein M5R36_23615 [Deltaproteobacteria bacterium]|nr:hypothetical protein [Deltaproteobacteria bacterium]
MVIIPLWLTFLVIKFMLGLMDNALLILPRRLRPDELIGFHIPGLGLVVSIFVILTVGFIARNFLGRRIVRYVEVLLENTPWFATSIPPSSSSPTRCSAATRNNSSAR